MKYGFGIDIGGTTVKLAFFSAQGEKLASWEIPTNKENGGANILPDIAASALGYLEENNIPKSDVLGLGVGVPGPVDEKGVVNGCVNLGWGVTDMEATLGALTGLKVKAGNDANVAALGECWLGGGGGCDDMIMVTLGTGVGGGIIVGGKLIHGPHGAGGEIGHICVNPEETAASGCGNHGCVEQYCSATGVVNIAKSVLMRTRDISRLRDIPDLTCKDVFDYAAQGDTGANNTLNIYFDYLGRFLATLCCVTDPEIIVLGGGVSKAGQPLLDGAVKAFQKYAFHACKATRFALAKLGNDAGSYGAFKLVLDSCGQQ